MKYRPFGNTGLELPILSFGASALGSMFLRQVEESTAIKTVHTALDLGMNYIDVSPFYGMTTSETRLGLAFKEINRDRFILSTKAGRYGDDKFDFSFDRITSSVDESLARMGVDHIDIYLIHDIEYGDLNQVIEEAIPAAQKLKEKGKVRFYGVTGYPLKSLRVVMEQIELDAILSYNHYTLNDATLLDLLPLAKEKGIGVINASPVSQGLLTMKEQLPDWHPAPQDVLDACKKAQQLCRDRGSDFAKLAMQFTTSFAGIPTTLVSSANPDNIKKNVKWIDEPMDQGLIDEILGILKPIHNKVWQTGRPENN